MADLLRTTDKIRSRVEAINRYIASCDMSIVVCRMDRVIDHKAFHDQINQAFKRRRSGSIIVVCSFSDDVNVNNKQSFPFISAEEKMMADIAEEEKTIYVQLWQVATAVNALKARKDLMEALKMSMKLERLERQKKILSNQRFEVRVMARSRQIKAGI